MAAGPTRETNLIACRPHMDRYAKHTTYIAIPIVANLDWDVRSGSALPDN